MTRKTPDLPQAEKRRRIKNLETLAEEIRGFIHSRKRPLVVEFSGIPKSGKTTAVNSLALFLRRNDIRVKVVTERASICPIREKHHPFFNVWTACTSLVQILDLMQSREFSVVVVDRGIYDSLIWLRLLHNIGKMTEEELRTIEQFLLLERWCRQVDLVIYMSTTPTSALDREFAALLTEKEGSIMNEATLKEYLRAADDTRKEFGEKFRRIISIDTADKNTIDGVEQITSEVLHGLKELSDEELVVLPSASLVGKLDAVGLQRNGRKLRTFERLVKIQGQRLKRSLAEQDQSVVQLVACATIRYGSEVLVFTKREVRSDQRFHGKEMVWLGGHLRWEDIEAPEHATFADAVMGCLRREMEEEISLSAGKLTFKGLLYDRTHPRSLQHLGLLFELKVDKRTRTFLDRRTFREYAGQELDARFIHETAIKDEVESIEPWSVDILAGLYGVRVPSARKTDQLVLF